MKAKKLYILPLLALALGACSEDDSRLFEQSAAERLEAGQKEYFSTLCADGGLWAMEYFANTEEPGYMFVMKFNDDKSVDVYTDHKWIDGKFHSERSLWDVINDNGNVLTFNSYNTLFHIFSTPENIIGPDAPVDTNNEDVDEQGYGHNGDYEFMLMENNDGNIRLLGKKRGLYTYLRRLDPQTDPEQFLADIAAKRKLFSNKKFPTYVMTETATSAEYDVTGLGSGVVAVMPHNSTSEFTQTEKKACIITLDGMRPYKAFDMVRADDSHFTVDKFTWADDGSLVAPGVRLTAPAPFRNLQREDLAWNVDLESLSPTVATALEDANEQTRLITIKGFGSNPEISKVSISYKSKSGQIQFALSASVGKIPCAVYGSLEAAENGNFKMSFTENDEALVRYIIPEAPKMQDFINLFSGEFSAENITTMDASIMTLTSVSNPEVSFALKVK